MTLTLRTMPLSTNTMYFTYGSRRILTKAAKERKASLSLEARAQYQGEPLDGPVRLKIALWWPTRANHDIDNIKMLLDALTGILWQDDGQIVDLHVTKGYDKAAPRVELSAEPA